MPSHQRLINRPNSGLLAEGILSARPEIDIAPSG
jgi:hypothetical protein